MTDSAVARVLAEQIQTLGTDALNLIVGNWELGYLTSGNGVLYQASNLRGLHVGSIHFGKQADKAVVHVLDTPSTRVVRAEAVGLFRSTLQEAGYVWLESVPLLAPWEEIPGGFERRLPGRNEVSIQALRAGSDRFVSPTTVLKATARPSAYPGRLAPYLDLYPSGSTSPQKVLRQRSPGSTSGSRGKASFLRPQRQRNL